MIDKFYWLQWVIDWNVCIAYVFLLITTVSKKKQNIRRLVLVSCFHRFVYFLCGFIDGSGGGWYVLCSLSYQLWRCSALHTLLRDDNRFDVWFWYFEHHIQQDIFLLNIKYDCNNNNTLEMKNVFTKIEQSPRAPVSFCMANSPIAVNAASVNSNCTLSFANSNLYCLIWAFSGSVKICTNILTSKLWKGTNTGKRPANSFKMKIENYEMNENLFCHSNRQK